MTDFSRFFRPALAATLACWLATGAALAQSGDANRLLFEAVRANDRAKAQTSLAEGADVNARNSLGMTAIDIAVDRGFYDMAHFLLAHRGTVTGGTAKPSAPGPLASDPVPVPSVQRSAPLGPPGSSPDYVTVPPAAAPEIRVSAPPQQAEPAPPPKLAPGQPNPFDPNRAVQATRAARPAPTPAAPAPGVPAVPEASPPATGGNLFGSIKNIFTPTPQPAAPPPAEAPAAQPADRAQPAPAAQAPAPAPAAPPEAKAPSEGPGLLDRLKGIFGSAPDKSSAVEPPAAPQVAAASEGATQVAATPEAAPPPPAKEQTVSMEQALARLDKAARLLETPPASAEAAAAQAAPAVPEPAPAAAEAAAPEASGPGFLDRLKGWFQKAETSPPTDAQTVTDASPSPADPPPPPPAAKPAPVAAWVGQTSAPFDPARPVAAAAPLPPEAVPVPPPLPPLPTDTKPPPQVAMAKPAAPKARETQPPLKGVSLALGRSLILGRAQATGPEAEQNCLHKKAWSGTYCIEEADWSDEARPLFQVSSSLYSGMKAVVRYDEGRATRYHAQFQTATLEQVVAYLEKVLGPPTDIPAPRMAWLGRTRELNTRFLWVSQGGAGELNAILDVRRYDDTSGTFPNSQFGSIQLYRDGSGAIFHELSSLDLTMHSVSAKKGSKR